MIRILCVEDHALVREGIASIIGRQHDMDLVAAVATGEEALEIYWSCRPDILLIDLQLPSLSGIEVIKAVHADDPDAKMIVVTTYCGDEDIFHALREGASSYLLKDSVADDLAHVVRAVHAGERPLTRRVETLLKERMQHQSLTTREIQVVRLIARGMRNKEIAVTLGISEATAKVHVKNVLWKLGVSDRSAAITIAMRRGILHL